MLISYLILTVLGLMVLLMALPTVIAKTLEKYKKH